MTNDSVKWSTIREIYSSAATLIELYYCSQVEYLTIIVICFFRGVSLIGIWYTELQQQQRLHISRNVNLSMFTLDTFVLVKCTYFIIWISNGRRGLRLFSLCFAFTKTVGEQPKRPSWPKLKDWVRFWFWDVIAKLPLGYQAGDDDNNNNVIVLALATVPSRRHRSSGIKVPSRCLVMVPPIECDLGYRFLRRTVNPKP